MNKIYKIISVLSLFFLLQACLPVKPEKTSLEIQAIQSREFETRKKITFASVLSVFQDMGYIINTADLETGFISAKSPIKQTRRFPNPVRMMEHTKATAFIEEVRRGVTKVRLNFVNSTEESNNSGQHLRNEEPIEDGQIYQKAFSKIREGIFIRKSIK